MTLCIIPARGGSKGIPGKNIASVGGKPLIAWTIQHAITAGLEPVIVSTDDGAIATIAMQYGATVFTRSAKTATDTASTESAVAEVLEHAPRAFGDVVVLLQCTSPIRQPNDIPAAIRLLRNAHCDSVFAARKVEGYTWQQRETRLWREYDRKPRQLEATHTLEENGSIYVFRPEVFMRTGDRICGVTRAYIMHPLDSFQIDEPDDIELIESLMQLRLPNDCAVAT